MLVKEDNKMETRILYNCNGNLPSNRLERGKN